MQPEQPLDDMSEHLWNGLERRKQPSIPPEGGTPDSEFWRYMVGQFETLNAKMNAMHIDMVGQKADLKHMQIDVDQIKQGFPKDDDGERDYDGHHNDHKTRRDAARTWREIWVDVRKKVFGGVTWAVLVFLAYSSWEYIKSRIVR